MFKVVITGSPHGPQRSLWTYRIYDLVNHRLAATDHTCNWRLIVDDARRTLADLHRAVQRGYYAPPAWLAGQPCGCPACMKPVP